MEVVPNTVDESSRFNVLHDGTLMIEGVRDADQGVYECVAKNVAGEAKTNAVEVKYQGTDSKFLWTDICALYCGREHLNKAQMG